MLCERRACCYAGRARRRNVERELVNHRWLRHPNIVRFHEVFLTATHLGIVMVRAARSLRMPRPMRCQAPGRPCRPCARIAAGRHAACTRSQAICVLGVEAVVAEAGLCHFSDPCAARGRSMRRAGSTGAAVSLFPSVSCMRQE